VRIIIRALSPRKVKIAEGTANVAGPVLRDVALAAAGQLDVARTHDADVRVLGCLSCDAAGPCYRNLGRLAGNALGVDIARSRDVIFGRGRLARGSLGSAGSGDSDLQARDLDIVDVEVARTGDPAFELVAGDAVDLYVARSGQRHSGECGHCHVERHMALAAPVEATALLRPDLEDAIDDLDLKLVEDVLSALGMNARCRARLHVDVVAAGQFDLIEIADLEIALGCGARLLFLAVRDSTPGEHCCHAGDADENGLVHARLQAVLAC
jgi:hypothetical protein